MTGQRPSVSCPRTRASRATEQNWLKRWIPAFAGMTVSAGVRTAVTEQPLRAPTNVRDGIQPHYGFRFLGWIISCIAMGRHSIPNLDS